MTNLGSGRRRGSRALVASAVLLATLGSLPARAADRPAAPSPAAGWVEFTASWTASGREHVLALGERSAATLELAGPFVVTTGEGLGGGFFARAIGFVEGGTIGIGRLVLTDERGEQIYGELRGSEPGTGRRIEATITGGSGRYAGLEGGFAFDWKYVLHTADGTLQGRAVDLHGRYRRPAPVMPGPSR